MTISYLLRLVCLSLSVFVVTHLILEAAVMLLLLRLKSFWDSLRPTTAARSLFALRMLPSAGSFFFVAAFCIPSYLIHEKQASSEEVGLLSLTLAATGLVLFCFGLRRALAAILTSQSYQRQCLAKGTRHLVGATSTALCVIESNRPLLVMAGLFRPSFIASSSLLMRLSQNQMEAALLHEQAHWIAKDNWKRLLMLLTPGLLPASKALALVERTWSRYAERAADDMAAAGNVDRAVALAEALVKVARMGSPSGGVLLTCSLLDNQQEFAVRVNRLLTLQTLPHAPSTNMPMALMGSTALTSLITALVACYPATLAIVYEVLEEFLH